jgi:dienelactone hydrolase
MPLSPWLRRVATWFIACFCFHVSLPAAPDSRADFLKLIDRPRVALAPQVDPPAIKDGLAQSAISYAVESSQRVPGLLIKSAVSTGRRPVVIALHGTGGNKEGQVSFLNEMAKAGFVGVAIDGRYHGARAKSHGKGNVDYEDAILRAFRGSGEHPFFFDSVWDVMRLIDYLETRDDVDPRRIGLIGISKGGIETYLTAAVDSRVAVAVPCISVESFRWALDHNSWQSRIGTVQTAFDAAAKDRGVTHPGADFVRTFYDQVSPGIYGEFDGPAMVPLIAPRPLLAINGELDPRTPLPGLNECAAAIRAAYQAQGASDKFVLQVQPKTAHKVLPESFDLARDWFVRWLQP